MEGSRKNVTKSTQAGKGADRERRGHRSCGCGCSCSRNAPPSPVRGCGRHVCVVGLRGSRPHWRVQGPFQVLFRDTGALSHTMECRLRGVVRGVGAVTAPDRYRGRHRTSAKVVHLVQRGAWGGGTAEESSREPGRGRPRAATPGRRGLYSPARRERDLIRNRRLRRPQRALAASGGPAVTPSGARGNLSAAGATTGDAARPSEAARGRGARGLKRRRCRSGCGP